MPFESSVFEITCNKCFRDILNNCCFEKVNGKAIYNLIGYNELGLVCNTLNFYEIYFCHFSKYTSI